MKKTEIPAWVGAIASFLVALGIGILTVEWITEGALFGVRDADSFRRMFSIAVPVVTAVFFSALSMALERRAERFRRETLQSFERRYEQHPEKSQYAWDLARARLESYLDRNLGQVRSIFWLTIIVMVGGYLIVIWGLVQATARPDMLSVPIIAAASGVIISFIGGSFLLIYRSIMSQSKDYVTVLERINAVGMAVQVLSNIPDASGELRHTATADLAKQLLHLYSAGPPKATSASGH